MSFLYSARLEEAASNDELVVLVIYFYRGHLLQPNINLNIYTSAATQWLRSILIYMKITHIGRASNR